MKTKAAAVQPRSAATRATPKPPPWPWEKSLGYRLKLALQAWTRHLDAALRPLGITHLQFFTLQAIEAFSERGETPAQIRIAKAMQFDQMMISKILRLLEQRGYLERSPHPDDPRANALYLTPAGRALVRKASSVARTAHAAFFDCRLDANGKETLAVLLDRLHRAGTATI
jgi:DNA-binding MarR family transcriptional regulator